MQKDGDTLLVYGEALDGLERLASPAITSISFRFVLFDWLASLLPRIRTRYPQLTTLTLSDTHIRSLSQINCLTLLKKLEVFLFYFRTRVSVGIEQLTGLNWLRWSGVCLTLLVLQ